MSSRTLVGLALLSLAALALLGCSTGPTPTPTAAPTSTPPPDATLTAAGVLALSRTASAAVESMRYVTTQELLPGPNPIETYGPLASLVEGEVDGDRFRIVSTTDGERAESLWIGNRVLTLTEDGSWREEVRDGTPATAASLLTPQVHNAEIVGDPEGDRAGMLHIHGDQLPFVPRGPGQPYGTVEITISLHDYIPRQIVTETMVSRRAGEPSNPGTVRAVTTFHGLGAPVAVLPPDTPIDDMSLSANEIVEKSREAAASVTSVQWRSQFITTTTRPDPEIDDDRPAEWFEIQTMDGRQRMRAHVANGRVTEELILENRTFSNYDGKLWKEGVRRSPQALFGPPTAHETLSPDIFDPVLLGETNIDGVAVYHLRGNRIPPSADTSHWGTVDLYIGKGDFLLRRNETALHSPFDEGATMTTRISNTYHAFNVPLTIERPDDVERPTVPAVMLGTRSGGSTLTFDTDREPSPAEWDSLLDSFEGRLGDEGFEGVVVEQDGGFGFTVWTAPPGETAEFIRDAIAEEAGERGFEVWLIDVTRG